MISNLEKRLVGIEPWGDSKVNWVGLGLNFNSSPCESNVAIIVTAWYGQMMWLRTTLANYRLSGAFVVCAYDQPFKIGIGDTEVGKYIPPPYIWILPHMWVVKHATYDADKRNGWFWDVIHAAATVNQFENFKYVFTVNGDCIWEKPQNMHQLIEMMGEGDLMSVSSTSPPSTPVIHTCAVLYKRQAFQAIVKYFIKQMRTPVIGARSPEDILIEAIEKCSLKEVKVPKQPMELDNSSVDHYSRYSQNSTWKEVVGYRNLGAEHITAGIERVEPVEPKYLDVEHANEYFSGHERETLLNFYKTGDRRYLYMYWDQGEDSWYDRVYHPLEHYGDSPIFEKEERQNY